MSQRIDAITDAVMLRCPNFKDVESFSALSLVAYKKERRLLLYAHQGDAIRLLKAYDFTGFSGKLGPKLREGDGQIPEGIYQIEGLNPNSRFYLSLRVNYPNAFDQQQAQRDGRENPGSDIYIHGKSATIGCIPVGDESIEELFYIVEKIGLEQVSLIIAPQKDMRSAATDAQPPWLPGLYDDITQALSGFPKETAH